MQYANVAVNTKTKKIDQVFTYSIPAKLLVDIKIGILVEVPFHNRKLEGVIVALKQYSNREIKYKLKPINKILDRNPVLDPIRLELATWMSNYYLAPIGEAIAAMLPAIAKRIIPKELIKLPITANTLKPHVYTLYDSIGSRILDYTKIIRRTIEKNKQVIMVFPEIAGKINLIRQLENDFGAKNISYLSGDLTITEKFQNWLDIRAGKKNIIIGSRAAIFAPASSLGLIIIDDPNNFGHKEEQSPKYHCVEVGKKLAKLSNAHLLLGSTYPTIDNCYFEGLKKYQVLKQSVANYQQSTINMIDSNKDKGIISWTLEQSIAENLKTNGKIILFVNHRGDGSVFSCNDCGYIFLCPHCNIPLAPFSNNTVGVINLRCSKCGYKNDAPPSCPKCQGTILKTSGIGTRHVEKKINKLFPNAKTLIVEKNERPLTTDDLRSADIIIGTKKLLDYPEVQADLVGVIGLDSALNIPDYNSNENTFLTLVELINRAKKQVILQTFLPDNEIIKYFADKQFSKFLTEELQRRKNNNYPPFASLIKLVYQNTDEAICVEETQKMAKTLSNQLPVESYQLIGPLPAYIYKKRDKYRYQIILKLKNVNSVLKTELSKVSFPKGWTIDVDPLDLL